MIGLVAFVALQGPHPSVLKYQRGTLSLSTNGGPFLAVADPLQACDVEDTTLDNSEPTVTEGGLYSLSGGMGKTILIRFGQLQRYLGVGAKIVDAQLILTQSSPDTPQLSMFGRVQRAWGEGPALTLNLPRNAPSDAVKAQPNTVTKAPIGGATWATPLFGIKGAKWDSPGAFGPGDTHPLIVKAHPSGTGTFVVENLGPQIQEIIAHPWLNNGFALQFSGPCEFASSESVQARPELDITFTPGEPEATGAAKLEISSMTQPVGGNGSQGVQITIRNLGQTASQPTTLSERRDGLNQDPIPIPAIGPGSTAEVTATYPDSKDDQRTGALQFWTDGSEASPSGGSTTYFPNALLVPIGVGKDANGNLGRALLHLSEFCNLALKRSRFSFSPGGSLARIELIPSPTLPMNKSSNGTTLDLDHLDFSNASNLTQAMKCAFLAAGATDFGQEQITGGPMPRAAENEFYGGGSLWFGGLLGGDNRYEGQLPPSLQLPQQAFQVSYVAATPTAPFGPLGAVTVGQMNDFISRSGKSSTGAFSFPHLILVRAFGGNGFNLKNQSLDFFRVVDGKVSPTAEFSLKTDGSGSVILPNRPVSSNGTGKNPFGTDRLEGAGSFAVRVKMGPSTAWALLTASSLLEANYRGNSGVAFADLRFAVPVEPIDATQNFGDDAAQTPGTGGGGSNAGDNWEEWDLHRDRPLGEVDLLFASQPDLDQIKVLVYNTGDTIQNAMTWATEPDLKWTYVNRGEPTQGGVLVRYFGPIVTARFIRVVASGNSPLKITKIGVFSPIVSPK